MPTERELLEQLNAQLAEQNALHPHEIADARHLVTNLIGVARYGEGIDENHIPLITSDARKQRAIRTVLGEMETANTVEKIQRGEGGVITWRKKEKQKSD